MRRILYCLLPVMLLSGCKSKEETKTEEITKVRVAEVQANKQSKKIAYSFITTPMHESTLAFRVGGPVEQMNLYPGNFYSKGALLAQIDPRDFILQQQQALAIFNHAQAEFQRIEKLYKKGNVSASTYENIKRELEIARVNLEKSENALKDTKLLAPFDGYIQELYIEEKDEVKGSQPILKFIDIKELRIEANVSQRVALMEKKISMIELRFDHLIGNQIDASLVDISKSTSPNKLAYTLTAKCDSKQGEIDLISGMTGDMMISMNGESSFNYLLPIQAICHSPNKGTHIWVVKDNKVIEQSIELGEIVNRSMVEVKGDLSLSDKVVLTGQSFLKDGDKVEW